MKIMAFLYDKMKRLIGVYSNALKYLSVNVVELLLFQAFTRLTVVNVNRNITYCEKNNILNNKEEKSI
jgi:hypothetical protein